MKVVFLDIDGVLNSDAYDRIRGDGGNIDRTRLELVKELCDRTGAKIVLSSSWRIHWEKVDALCDDIGLEIKADFASAGLEIFDKTPKLKNVPRSDEVLSWLREHPETEKFVIFDDSVFGWGELSDFLVLTSAHVGRGLETEHIERAIGLLS